MGAKKWSPREEDGGLLAILVTVVSTIIVAVVVAATPALAQDGDRPSAPPGCVVKAVLVNGVEQWKIYCNQPGTETTDDHGPQGPATGTVPAHNVEYGYSAGSIVVDGQRCWRIYTHEVPVGQDHSYYEDPETLGNLAQALYGDGVPRCPADPFVPEPTPEQLAMQAWEQMVAGLVPDVTTQPADSSVVGLPTFLMVAPYSPGGDVDSSPTTVTRDYGAFQLRATSAHMVEWADGDDDNEFAYAPAWQRTNGREYIEGDESGPTGWSEGQPNWQGGTQPLAWIYQEAGERGVTVTVRWEGEWRLPGGAWQDLAAPDLFGSSNVAVDVREYQAVITE